MVSQVVVIVMSLGFILFVTILHIIGKVGGTQACVGTASWVMMMGGAELAACISAVHPLAEPTAIVLAVVFQSKPLCL